MQPLPGIILKRGECMSVKLMVLDVDGTLTDERGNISPENASAVRKALRSGIQVSLATGRPYQGVEAICSELGISGPLILGNGSLILHEGEIWHEDYFSESELKMVYRHGEARGKIGIAAFQPDVVRYWVPGEMDRAWISGLLDSYMLFQRFSVPSPDELPLQRVNKVMLMGNVQSVTETFQTWPKELSHLATGRSYPYLGEVNPSSVNKGAALLFVCRRLEISPKEVLAMGDGETDLPMLRIAGIPVFVSRCKELPGLPEDFAIVPEGQRDCGVAWAAARYL